MLNSGVSLASANGNSQASVNLHLLNMAQNSPMDTFKIRIANLQRLVDAYPKAVDFARANNIDPSYLSQILNGHRSFGEKSARNFEKKLGLERMALDIPPAHNSDNTSPAVIEGYVPLISYVQAGEWAEAIDLYEPGFAEQVRATTVPHSMSTFALRVDGDSMTLPAGVQGKSFPHGMIIFVDPERDADIGDYVVAKHNGDGQVTFKRLMTEEGRPVLVPLNPDRVAYPVLRDEFDIIGRVIDASWGGL